MEIYKNYKDYRQYKPEYKEWKNSRSIQEAKREAYIKSQGISDAAKSDDIKRANAVLNAVDIMDEYSQSKAENMELATQSFQSTVLTLLSYVGSAVGLGLCFLPPVKKCMSALGQKFKIGDIMQFLPAVIGPIIPIIFVPKIMSWSASKEVGASRTGRYEAMTKDLNSINHFAVLTDEQENEVKEKAKSIIIPEKEANKKIEGATSGIKGIFKAYKELIKEDKSYLIQRDKLNKQIDDDRKKFDTVALSEKDIENAKKDQQLIGNVVEKIDIASQDYAENVEFLTNTLNAVSFGGGGLLGFGINKLLSKVNFKNPNTSQMAGGAIGLTFMIGLSILAVKLQKQASRVARFKVKEDFKNNPHKILYVDDDKVKDITDYKVEKEKKQNIFSFLIQTLKDNKEYNNYIKTQGIEDKKKRKAVETIKLTPEQQKDAKRLQNNVFKTFNEVDEKSQVYAESTEALGEIVQSFGNVAILGLGALAGAMIGKKTFKPTASVDLKELRTMFGAIGGMMASTVPIIALDAYVTKEQKNASRVADMLGLEELKDYRNYADYSSGNADMKTVETSNLFSKYNINELFNKFKK